MATIRRMETGYFIADNTVFDRRDLTCQEKLVYLNLCRRADSSATAFPSYQRIARDCSISRSSAIRAVKGLEEKGLLIKEVRRNQAGDYITNEYILLNPSQIQEGEGGSVTVTPPQRNDPKRGVVSERHHLVSERHQVVSERHLKDNPCKDHVVVVNTAHARAREDDIAEMGDIVDKRKSIASSFGDEVVVPDDVLADCSVEDVKASVAAARTYADRNDVQNISGLVTQALRERWVAQPREASASAKSPSGGVGKKKTRGLLLNDAAQNAKEIEMIEKLGY